MAARYWVGGSATWDATAGTKWATVDGGVGGATVPTSADDVYFTAASGAVSVTPSVSMCANLNFTGFTGSFIGTLGISVYGNFTASSSMTWTNTGTISIFGTCALTSAGKTFGSLQLMNTPSNVTLQDALNLSSALTITAGTFTTNNYAVTATQLVSTNSNVRTINLGSSTLTFSTTATAVSLQTNTNLTFNAGTSTIIVSGANANLTGGSASATGVTFNNVSFTTTTAGTLAINGANTFNDLSISAPSAAGVMQLIFDSPQTINGTLSTTSTAGNRRVWFRGATYGLAQTLTINGSTSLTDADFRDIIVKGTASPISGTRIGDLRGCSGITFDAPKTVYWNLAGAQNWSANGWAATSTGTPSTDYFPLAQDTATFTNAGSVTGTITMDSAIPYTGTVDMSGRTSAMTLTGSGAFYVYGDWKNGSGLTLNLSSLFFSGRNTQNITSAGKSFSGSGDFVIDSYGGTVQLTDALSFTGSGILNIVNGTFKTNGYSAIVSSLNSNNSNVRTIDLGASTVTLKGSGTVVALTTSTNLTFNAGTSQINNTSNTSLTFQGGGQTFYNVTFTGTAAATHSITGLNTFNNLTFTATTSTGIMGCTFAANQTINGTLTCSGATAVRRIFLRSDTLGTTRTLTVNSLSANDCDFRDITIAGAAAGTAPTRAGDCGGNSGITFPAPKTVYWNPAASAAFASASWATSSGGTTLSIDNFPLAQDTMVIDNSSRANITSNNDAKWNIGSFNSSTRTTAFTLTYGNNGFTVHKDWSNGTGMTFSGNVTNTFSGRTTQTITSNGVSFDQSFTVDNFSGTVQLADAFTTGSARTLTLTSGTFDAVSYNVTTGLFTASTATNTVLKMGSGTWTLSGTGSLWTLPAGFTLYKGTANIVLSDTSTTARTFSTGNLSYNKITIGGTTGTSTLTITGVLTATELASTKTVAHTINFINGVTLGKWSVTGTVGNVVTVSGGQTITIAGAAVSGVDYLAMGTTALSTTSPAEFYAGANSTGTGTGITLTAAPSPRTLYWVGGTGNWSDTAHWSTTSGSGSGAAIPTSLDSVNFDSGSNATAYTATIDTGAQRRCAALNIAGPASGNVTIAGTGGLALAGNMTIAATGVTRTYTGNITLSGASSNTFTTNGVLIGSSVVVNGVGSTWTLGSACTFGSGVTVTNGTFNTGSYTHVITSLASIAANSPAIYLGSSSITFTLSSPLGSFTYGGGMVFDAGTSSIIVNSGASTFNGAGATFYNVSFTSTSSSTTSILGSSTFNNLSIAGRTSAGINIVSVSANQTINGTLTLSAGTDATCRTMATSSSLGTPRTLTCNAVAALQDIDFRDITIAGNAVSGGNLTGTRLGDCKGNTGITFDAPKTVYWRAASTTTWASNANNWADSPTGGSTGYQFIPLAQDTAVFTSTYPNAAQTITINADYNIGTIDMSERTSNTMTLATSSTTPAIYGNWVNGTGVTLSGTGAMTFAGRGSQTITSAGVTFTQPITVNSPSGSVTLQDAYINSGSSGLTLTAGTFNANNYNVSLTSAGTSFTTAGALTRTIAFGSGVWTCSGTGTAVSVGGTNLTITGTGTISLNSASAHTFTGGGLSYSGITLNQGGAGALTITGNNTFANITNTYNATGAATIILGTTTQTVNNFTATGAAGKVLTVQGTSASSPGTLILNSGTVSTVDYLTITGIKAYSTTSTWYAGTHSTNFGSLGWIFSAAPTPPVTGNSGFFFMMGC